MQNAKREMMNAKCEIRAIAFFRFSFRIYHFSFLVFPSSPAVCFLLHFPEPCGRWALPTTLSCGVRTFLPPRHKAAAGERPSRSESEFSLLARTNSAQWGDGLRETRHLVQERIAAAYVDLNRPSGSDCDLAFLPLFSEGTRSPSTICKSLEMHSWFMLVWYA